MKKNFWEKIVNLGDKRNLFVGNKIIDYLCYYNNQKYKNMTEKMIIDAHCHIKTIDQTIPDDVLDFMKDSAIEKLRNQSVGDSLLFSKEDIKKKLDDLGLNGKYIVSHFKSNDR